MKRIFYPVFILLMLSSCDLETPEIRGIVLDAETKQPVENAWISANIELNSKTIGGDVHSAISLDIPHTRTDKQGKFVIPSKNFRSSIGAEVLSFGVGASTVDDKGGGIKYFGAYYKRDYGKGDGDLAEILKKNRAEFTIYVKPIEKTESEYSHHLQSLYNYCISGRFSVETPAVKEGCDNWELDYAITKHERYLERWKNPQLIENPSYGVSKWDRIIRYSSVQQQLGDLFKKRGDYKKALTIFEQVKEFDKKHGLSLHVKEYESQINELQQKLQEKQNQGVEK